MKRRLHTQLPSATINLTPLLDVTFVLLIAFMVVAPALRYSVDLKLPAVEDSENNSRKEPITIGVTFNEKNESVVFHLNGNPTNINDLPDNLKLLKGYTPNEVVALEADRRVPWESMAQLINLLKINGIENIGIVTEQGAK
jgi:biopolymer transport protein ExbD